MANATTDHDEIRKWAEAKGGKPAAVERTHQGGDVGIIRIMFPDNPQSEHQSLVEISWDEFFEQFEESNLALLYDEDGLFSKIVGRDTVERREHGEHVSRHHGGESHRGGKEASAREGRHQQPPPQTRSASKSGKDSDDEPPDDLKSREYRDEHGNVHHHTRSYIEQHGGKK